MPISRREVIVPALALPLVVGKTPSQPLKIVVAGAHPGDPECGCAGTICRYSALGHQVSLLYMNRGEGFCGESELTRCGSIRTREAEAACKLLRARAVFGGQVDGKAVVDNSRYDAFQSLLHSEKPDIVFCHWPVDSHRDHRALSSLVLDAWLQSEKHFALYYYEVSGDSMMFSPTQYVDISDAEIEGLRRAACYSHASQDPDKWFPAQVDITRFRGSQSGYKQAEGFVRHWESRGGFLP